MTRPDRSDAAEYYWTYINKVPGGAILDVLRAQLRDVNSFLTEITEQQSLQRYAPGKWSLREVMSHVNDAERVFVFRALWFARGYDSPLPSFDQDVAIAHANADGRTWASHVDEFRSVRAASLTLFDHLPAEAWFRRGVASGNPFSVNALAYITAGHLAHHVAIIRERYL
jgi:hypothetical protein